MVLSDKAREYLDDLSLTEDQAAAAAERSANVVVTAGAGSGKTRTLVARYVSLLADGFTPETVLAITFTEKAAREMRSRVRAELRRLVIESEAETERAFWQLLERRMETARIGTIHSLCAEVIRMNPASAGVDPQFEVMDDGKAAIARADVVNQVLTEASQDPAMLQLFELFKSQTLEKIITGMLKSRLSLLNWQVGTEQKWQPIQTFLAEYILDDEVQSIIRDLKILKENGALQADTTPNGVEKAENLLVTWQELERAYHSQKSILCCQLLSEIRKGSLGGNLGRNNSQTKEMLTILRDFYDERFGKWLEGHTLDEVLEDTYQQITPLLKYLFDRAEGLYRKILANEQSLDFDDLEKMALTLLETEGITNDWQERINCVLVDEFQDTNQRQRKIVELICGDKAGKLFVVGDARQSIYRFRGADVTVFQSVQQQTQREGGQLTELDLTFRTHTPLLDGLGGILKMVMGTKKDGRLLFEVPFTPMRTEREAPTHTSSPFIECQIGFGQNSSAGRKAAAVKLVNRLLDLKSKGEIIHWQDVAILFRSSSVFGVYEDTLEKAGIPYVTVAGRGFYDRPEIRDILNILRALADPWDDLAMTGLLRSPAVGMSDLGIYQLRWGEENEKLSLSKAVKEQRWSVLNETDTAAGKRAQALLENITPLIGRVPVVEITQQVLSLTCYRAVLAGREERVWRNVDKLLQDPYAGQLTSIHAYLEILDRLKGSDAREGEAPGEAGEAVQLMTIHKAKGLEFPVLVLGDMGRQDHVFRDAWLPLGDTAVACKGDVQDYEPLLFRLAKQIEKDQTSAEDKRLFYVATTRVKDKLILNGHCSQMKKNYTAKGWLKTVLSVLGVEPDEVVKYLSGKNISLPDGETVWVEASDLFVINQAGLMEKSIQVKQAQIGTLYQPLSYEQKPQPSSAEKPDKKTRLQPDPNQPAAQAVIGKMLHRVIQFWQFSSQADLETLFHRTALEFGVIDLVPRQAAVKQVKTYLERFQAHLIYKEIDRASVRYHEVPYGLMDDPQSDRGRLDILYQLDGEWWIVDFKTDPIQPETGMPPQRAEVYIRQLSRYRDAVESQLKAKVRARLCFLDYEGGIRLFDLEDGFLVKP